jgi:PadR family transcriptional regulator PadR
MIEISSDVIRGYNDTMILYILRNAPSYGYEISKNIKSMTDGKYIIKETTLYSAFTRMEKNGYIESFSGQEDRRTYYRITDSGRKFYSEKCDEWELTKEVVEKFIASQADEAYEKDSGNE